MNVNERIKKVRKYYHLSQKELAQKIGMSQNAISWSERPGNHVPESTLKYIAAAFNVREDFLKYGTGPMLSEPQTFSLDKFVKAKGASELELEIIKAYFELDPSVRKTILTHFHQRFSASNQALNNHPVE